ncbi:MAG: hypothetical protein HGB17_16420, partial [Syntrophobacteraceae bacterium]|nr:hypothetical protein [Syntrophobacteraceae bacterium]
SGKSSEPVKAAAPVVLEDIHAETKDLKGTTGAGSASSASTSKPASAPPAAASKGLERVKEVELPPAGNGAKPAASLPLTTPGKVAASPLVDLADPRSDPLLSKGATSGTVVAKPVASPVASVPGSVDARLERVKDVQALGTIVGAGAAASTVDMEDLRDLKPKTSAGGLAPTPITPKPLTADERLRRNIEDVVVGKAVEEQKKLVAELTRAVSFKIAGPNSLSPVRPPWISSMDWNHMPVEDRQAAVSWEVQMILSGMAPFVSQGAQAVNQAKGDFIDWVHKVVLPGCSGNPAQIPTAQELSWIYAKNSPGGELVGYLWVCSHNAAGGPVSWRLRSAPGLEMPSIAWAPYMGIVRWNGEVARDKDGLLWYSVSYSDGQGVAHEGWMADHDTDGMTGLAPYRPSEGGWQFGDQDTPIPLDPLALTYGYGQGVDGWARYRSGGSVAQFLNMQALAAAIGLTGAFPSTHKNLCGQLAIFRALGVSLEEGFRIFSQIPACGGSGLSGLEILQQGATTWGDHLRATFEAFGCTVHEAFPAVMETGLSMQAYLAGGDIVIANVRCDPSGKVVPEGTIEHWVQVTDVR